MADKRSKPIPIVDLVADDRCQARSEIRAEIVAEYAALYGAGGKTKLPPIEVFEVEGELIIIDGFHRFAAAIKAGCEFIRCVTVGSGSQLDAAWVACASNQAHTALRRSNADKRAAVWLALDGIGGEQSSRVIADHVGVSHDFVSRIMKEWEANQLSSDDSCEPKSAELHEAKNENARRQGLDGKWRKAHKQTAFDAAVDDPDPQLKLDGSNKEPQRDPHEIIRAEYQGTRTVFRRLRKVLETYANFMFDSDSVVIKLAECCAEIEQRMTTLEHKMKGRRL